MQQVENLPPGDGFYFAMVIGLTIGYGDITPKTWIGRAVALLLGFTRVPLLEAILRTLVFVIRAWDQRSIALNARAIRLNRLHSTETDAKFREAVHHLIDIPAP